MKTSVIPQIAVLFYFARTFCVECIIPWDTFASHTPVFKVLYDVQNESVLVGAQNYIYKLNRNLNTTYKEVRIGPTYDNPNCPPHPLPCQHERVATDNDVKIMLFAADNCTLICGTINQGMCRLYNRELRSFVLGYANATTSYVAGKETVAAFFTKDKSDHETLYVAKSYGMNDINDVLFGYAISSRVIVPDPKGKPVFEFSHSSNQAVSAVNLHSYYRTSSHTKYVYGFGHGDFSYFLLTQRLREGMYETRIARVCHGDISFFSYSEMALKCMKAIDKAYLLATTAYLGDASTTLKRARDMELDEKVLYVIFGRNQHGQEPLDENGSLLCMFPMGQIQRAFENATRDCFKGEPRSRRIKTLLGSDTRCVKALKDGETVQDVICKPGINHYIEGRETIQGGVRATMDEVATSLAVSLQHSSTVAFVGTKSGNLSKYILEKNDSQGLMYNIRLEEESEETESEILSSNAFDEHEQHLYLLKGNKVIRFPVGSCSPYMDCKSCVTKKDSLMCGWCGDRCSTKQRCSEGVIFQTGQCPPSIHEVYPLTGHEAGGTTLTIKGENLGSVRSGANGNVTVAGVNCEILDWHNEMVQCRTGAAKSSASGPVVVTVLDTSYETGFDINGTAVYNINFSFLTPKLFSITPKFGAFSGGTEVTLVGENLDIGSSQTVSLAGYPCSITRKNTSHLICKSSAFSPKDSFPHTQNANGTVSLWIDGNKLDPDAEGSSDQMIFEYRPDPEIIDINPKETSMSGGTDLTVRGRHLDSVANPFLVVTVTHLVSGDQENISQACRHGDPPDRLMMCRTPSLVGILGAGLTPTGQSGIPTHMSFLMDGVVSLKRFPHERPPRDSLLLYFRDPEFHPFTENLTTVRTDTRTLVIKGSNLNLGLRTQDVVVSVNTSVLCNVTELVEEELRCVLPEYFLDDSLHNEFPVTVRAGNLEFFLGRMRFVPPPPHSEHLSNAGVVGVSMAAIMIAVVLAVVTYKIWTRKRTKAKTETSGFIVSYRDNHAMDATTPTNDYGDHPGGISSFFPGGGTASANSRVLRVSEDTMHLLSVENILISRENLTLQKEIGQGHFGRVYKGQLEIPDEKQTKNVAVKTLHNCRYQDTESAESFLQEGLMMKDFVHPHVLTLIGVCFEDTGFPMVILPFMKYGDLKSYIQDENNEPTIKTLIEFGIQVADGMKYLSDLKFVHRDLAARNCMLDEDLTVKVADFGLSRDVYERDYYSSDNTKSKLPVKWMAPESLEKGTYSTKSDVWSFGVVLWELMTRGVTPYPEVGNWEILTFIKSGRRMLQPSYCPDDIYRIMLRCWQEDARRRPAFSEVAEEIRDVVSKMKNRNRKVGLEVTYVNLPLPGTSYEKPRHIV